MKHRGKKDWGEKEIDPLFQHRCNLSPSMKTAKGEKKVFEKVLSEHFPGFMKITFTNPRI